MESFQMIGMNLCGRYSITTGQKVGQNHRFENEPRRHVGALVPCCRWKNDKKWRLGTMLSMD
jgi:hypothetical protein